MRTLGNHLLGVLVLALSLGAGAQGGLRPARHLQRRWRGPVRGGHRRRRPRRPDRLQLGEHPDHQGPTESGDGTFRAAASLTGALGRLCQWSYKPHLEDVNGDGHLDVAAFSFKQTSKIYTLPGWGTGADFTLDENIWLGRGDGTFAPLAIRSHYELKAWQLPEEDFRVPGTFAEFNHDGVGDVASLSRDKMDRTVGPVLVYLRVPTTADDPALPDLSVEIGSGVFSTLASGDFDGDGWADLVVSKSKTLKTLLNDARW